MCPQPVCKSVTFRKKPRPAPRKNVQTSAWPSQKPGDYRLLVSGAKPSAYRAVCTRCDYIVLTEVSLIIETGRKLRAKLYVMTRGQTSYFQWIYCLPHLLFLPTIFFRLCLNAAQWKRQYGWRRDTPKACLVFLTLTLLCKLQYNGIAGTNLNPTTGHFYWARDRMRKFGGGGGGSKERGGKKNVTSSGT